MLSIGLVELISAQVPFIMKGLMIGMIYSAKKCLFGNWLGLNIIIIPKSTIVNSMQCVPESTTDTTSPKAPDKKNELKILFNSQLIHAVSVNTIIYRYCHMEYY